MSSQLVKELKIEKDGLTKQLRELEAIIAKDRDLRNRIVAIDQVLSFYKSDDKQETPSNAPINESLDYDKNMIWEDKCLFALKELGTGYAFDIANKIMQLEPALQEVRVRTAVSFYLSKLLKEKKVKKISQSGRKYRFSLN